MKKMLPQNRSTTGPILRHIHHTTFKTYHNLYLCKSTVDVPSELFLITPQDITDKLNAQANADQAAGTTSINAGNAGVGFFQTDVVDELLGGSTCTSCISSSGC